MRYTPYYCEENIYHLAKDRARDTDWVVLISNTDHRVGLAQQRAGADPAGLVAWDYHVILVDTGPTALPDATRRASVVLDLDTRLGPSVPAGEYLDATFPARLYERYPDLEPRFSLVRATDYLKHFSSNRSHMRNQDGSFAQPAPAWPPIYSETAGNTLFALVDAVHEAVDQVMDRSSFRDWVT